MSSLHNAVLDAFRSQGWSFREVPGREVIEAGFDTCHGRVLAHVQSFPDARLVSVVANSSIEIPLGHRSRAAELLMRTNTDLSLGAFELLWDEGRAMFRQGNVFPPGVADGSVIAGLVHNAVCEMDRITPFLGELCRMAPSALSELDVLALIKREDLLPQVKFEV